MKNETTGRKRAGLGRMAGNGECRRNKDDGLYGSGKGNKKNGQCRRGNDFINTGNNNAGERLGSTKDQVDE